MIVNLGFLYKGFKVREHIATDGVFPKIGRLINKLNEKQYRQWLDFNIEICKCEASIENTLHALIIAEKIALSPASGWVDYT